MGAKKAKPRSTTTARVAKPSRGAATPARGAAKPARGAAKPARGAAKNARKKVPTRRPTPKTKIPASASRSAGKTRPPTAYLFELGAFPLARRLLRVLGRQAFEPLPCMVSLTRDDRHWAFIWDRPEPTLSSEDDQLVSWLIATVQGALTEETDLLGGAPNPPMTNAYHAGFDLPSLRAVLQAAGVRVLGLDAATPARPARRPPPRGLPAALSLRDDVEAWDEGEKAIFAEHLRKGIVPALGWSPADELVLHDDRLLLLEALAGPDAGRVRTAVFDGILGDGWTSAEILRLDGLNRWAADRPPPEFARVFDVGTAVERAIGVLRDSSLPEPLVSPILGIAEAKLRAEPRPTAPAFVPGGPKLRAFYGFDWPEEIDRIWDFARQVRPDAPLSAFAAIRTLDLELVGPFEVLAGKLSGRKLRASPLLHWRYFGDLPELFTVLVGRIDRDHLLYAFDETLGVPGCVVSYHGNDAFEMSVKGLDLCEALRARIELAQESLEEAFLDEPRGAPRHLEALDALAALREAFKKVATGDRHEQGRAYGARYDRTSRRRRATWPTPERLGVVAPPSALRAPELAGDGGAPSPLLVKARKDARLRRRLVAAAREASDEGFFADALLVGRSCWAAGDDASAYDLLDRAYAGLGREGLREVLRVHRSDRRRADVSLLG